jgi:valyl-tRNA synthetase
MVVTKEDAPVCPKCGKPMRQDPDTLDTWFSSALWPFSTLGWPDDTEEMDYFYPTSTLVTGYDIIFFWVIRMMFSGLEHTGEVPFDTVLIHGLVRDSQGRKMSKSLGNGIDPLEVIDKYGADALRFTLVTGNAPGNDMRFYWERVEASRNFANKVWNASRFIMMHLGDNVITEPAYDELKDEDRWILSMVNTLTKEVTDNMEKYELGVAVQKIYDFIWTEFCDWYIELVKPRLFAKEQDKTSANAAFWTLRTVLIDSLKLLHPYMPFITEEIFCTIQSQEESIMISSWPVYKEEWVNKPAEEMAESMKNVIRGIRNLRSEMNVANSRKAKVYIVADDKAVYDILNGCRSAYEHMIYASELFVQQDKTGVEENAVSVVIPKATIYMPLADLVDFAKEKERLTKEKKRLEGELKRVNGMLSNEKFISKAPAEKIAQEREKLEKYTSMMTKVEEELDSIKAMS